MRVCGRDILNVVEGVAIRRVGRKSRQLATSDLENLQRSPWISVKTILFKMFSNISQTTIIVLRIFMQMK